MITHSTVMSDLRILAEVQREMERQVEMFGVQHHPMGTGGTGTKELADFARDTCDKATKAGLVTWVDILREEVAEAFAESESAKVRQELIQVCAVAASMIRDIDMAAAEDWSIP